VLTIWSEATKWLGLAVSHKPASDLKPNAHLGLHNVPVAGGQVFHPQTYVFNVHLTPPPERPRAA